MGIYFRCDFCNKEQPAVQKGFNYKKPEGWLIRLSRDGGSQVACTQECANKIPTPPPKQGPQ